MDAASDAVEGVMHTRWGLESFGMVRVPEHSLRTATGEGRSSSNRGTRILEMPGQQPL